MKCFINYCKDEAEFTIDGVQFCAMDAVRILNAYAERKVSPVVEGEQVLEGIKY